MTTTQAMYYNFFMKKTNINNFENRYIAYSDGRIFSLIKNRFLKFSYSNTTEYLTVLLSNKKIKKQKLVHRVIAETFIPNPKNKPCVNHIDGNKLNNNIKNLEWVTYSENMQHAFKIGLCELTKKNGIKNLKKYNLQRRMFNLEDIKFIILNPKELSQRKLANHFEVGLKTIQNILNGESYVDLVKEIRCQQLKN